MKKFFLSPIIVLTIDLIQGYAQNTLDSGLVAYYPFNGNDSDNSVYGNHPIFNSATLTEDRFGNENGAYKFDGQSNSIQIKNAPSLNFSSTVSLCAWVKVSGFYYGLCHGNMIMQKGDNGTVSGQYQLLFSDANYTNGANCNGGVPDTIHQSFYGTGSGDTANKIQKDRWYFLTVTYDGVYSKFYVNSKLQGISYMPGYAFTNNHDLFLGKMNHFQYPYWLNGSLDDIRIYNRVLSREEVRKLYTETPSATLVGNIFVDNNADGVKDSLDYESSYTKIKLSNRDCVFTDYSGKYAANIDSAGVYQISIDSSNAYTPSPLVDSVNILNLDTTITKNFRMLLNANAFDSLRVNIIPLINAARPGFSYPCVVNYVNTGNTILSVANNFLYDTAIMQYDSSSSVSVIKNWNVLSVNTNQMHPSQRNVFIAYFTVKPTAHLGDSIKLYTTASGGNAIAKDSIWARIRGSYDPNEKDATPVLTTAEVAQGKHIDYIIRFENTGTDTAFRVVITDKLSSFLDKNSIQITSISHPCSIQVNDNKVSFVFNNILLPQNTVDKIGCHGYVAFRIKPNSTATNGTDILNAASIYFDYNLPILTNTAVTKIKNPFITPLKFISYELKSLNENNSIGNTQAVVNLWKTANEMNVHHFNVQRSFNGKDFINVGEVIALNKINNDYSFIDVVANNLLSPIIYYRLEAIDKDGSKTYSSLKTIIVKSKDLSIQVYPNPAMDQISIQRKTDKIETVSIIDIDGKIVKTIQLNKFLQTISIKELQNGIYLLKFEHSEMIKLIKQ